MTLADACWSPRILDTPLHPRTELKDVPSIFLAHHEHDEFPMLWPYLGEGGLGVYDDGYRRLPDGRVVTKMPDGWTTPY